MFDFLFNPLAQAQRRLKNVENLILEEEALLHSQPKLAVVELHNREIRAALEKAHRLLFKEAKKYQAPSRRLQRKIGYEACIVKYHSTIKTTMVLDEVLGILSEIEKEVSGEKATLEAIGDSTFTAEWLKDLDLKYRQMFVDIQLLEHELFDREVREKTVKAIPRNVADSYLRQGALLTKEHQLLKLAKVCRYKIIDGEKHSIVRDKEGNKITEIPHHKELDGETSRRIMRAMAEGRFIGRRSA